MKLLSIVGSLLLSSALAIGFGCSGKVGNNAGPNDAVLTWDAPTTNDDPPDYTPLTDLAGYRVYYGTASGSYDTNVDVGNVTTHTVADLVSGSTYYFTVTAYDTSGNESVHSDEVSKAIP